MFGADGQLFSRSFVFSAQGLTGGDAEPATPSATRSTTVPLVGFRPQYRTSVRKSAEAIANALLEHCLWYFVRPGSAPTVLVEDDGESLSLEDVFERHMHSSAVQETTSIKETRFELLHVKLRAGSSAGPPSVERRCRIPDLTRTSDGMGCFGRNSSFQAYVAFDRLANAAKQRNQAFFDKLGLPLSLSKDLTPGRSFASRASAQPTPE